MRYSPNAQSEERPRTWGRWASQQNPIKLRATSAPTSTTTCPQCAALTAKLQHDLKSPCSVLKIRMIKLCHKNIGHFSLCWPQDPSNHKAQHATRTGSIKEPTLNSKPEPSSVNKPVTFSSLSEPRFSHLHNWDKNFPQMM